MNPELLVAPFIQYHIKADATPTTTARDGVSRFSDQYSAEVTADGCKVIWDDKPAVGRQKP